MSIKLDFFGAARNVTGSSYLVETAGKRLLVDHGIYQERELRYRNHDPFPIDPRTIDAVLLTHAHLDHCGLLPRLVRAGFQGPIHCTPATADLAEILLLDSAKIQAEDAAFKQKRHAREGRASPYPEPEQPLYTEPDVKATVARFQPVEYGRDLALAPGLTASFHDAGHILGSAMIRLVAGRNGDARSVVFSGDVGRWNTPILRDPTVFEQADYVLTESTYGDRVHRDSAGIRERLVDVISSTWRAGGNVVVPSFVVERTQELLYRLNDLLNARAIPHLPVYVDSPMAVKVTEVFQRHPELFDEDTLDHLRRGDHPCDFPGLTMCRGVEESKAINALKRPAIIIAGSGMCTGGRIKHHLANNVGRPQSTVMFVGYQATGTLGRILLEGAKTVRILGHVYDVKARVTKINGFSAHADREELFRWLSGLRKPPRRVFVTHGEPSVAAQFAGWLHDQTQWNVAVAEYRQAVMLD